MAEPTSPNTLEITLPGGVPLRLNRIPADSFRMGERGGYADAEPVHRVTIPEDFYLGVFPVTQAQYRAMAGACAAELGRIAGNLGGDPSHFKGDLRPVEQVSWDDARGVCRWLTGSGLLPAGWIADLPGEAQWEYACRGGTETVYWSGDREEDLARVGWYGGNAGGETHEVASRGEGAANGYGLYDVHGNVWEWCLDYYDLRAYRKCAEGDPARPVLDPAELEFAEANPRAVAIAEVLGRVATGELELKPGDEVTIRVYQDWAQEWFDNGNKQWEVDVESARSARARGRWRESDRATAKGSLPVFQRIISNATNRSDPPRVLRGGAWIFTAAECRAAYRDRIAPGQRSGLSGFRLGLVRGSGEALAGAERAVGGGARREAAAEPETGRGAEAGVKEEARVAESPTRRSAA